MHAVIEGDRSPAVGGPSDHIRQARVSGVGELPVRERIRIAHGDDLASTERILHDDRAVAVADLAALVA